MTSLIGTNRRRFVRIHTSNLYCSKATCNVMADGLPLHAQYGSLLGYDDVHDGTFLLSSSVSSLDVHESYLCTWWKCKKQDNDKSTLEWLCPTLWKTTELPGCSSSSSTRWCLVLFADVAWCSHAACSCKMKLVPVSTVR